MGTIQSGRSRFGTNLSPKMRWLGIVLRMTPWTVEYQALAIRGKKTRWSRRTASGSATRPHCWMAASSDQESACTP